MTSPARPDAPANDTLGIFPTGQSHMAVAPHEVRTFPTWEQARDWLEERGIAPDGERLEILPLGAA